MCKTHIEVTSNTPNPGSVPPQPQTPTEASLSDCPASAQGLLLLVTFLPLLACLQFTLQGISQEGPPQFPYLSSFLPVPLSLSVSPQTELLEGGDSLHLDPLCSLRGYP